MSEVPASASTSPKRSFFVRSIALVSLACPLVVGSS